MFADNELDYLQYCQSIIEDFPQGIKTDGNSLCKKILNLLKNQNLLISRNGHDQLPPDFYSEIYKIMFDALRVNDTEIINKGKFKNPKFARERMMEKELKQKINTDNKKIICNSENLTNNEHSLINFSNQAQRTINEHINKIKIWEKELPDMKYKGLFIFDESDLYFKGTAIPLENSKWCFLTQDTSFNFYYPWLDKNIMEPVYNSNLNFIVWFCPYKFFSSIGNFDTNYFNTIILDVRYNNKNLIQYNYNEYALS